MVMIDGILPSRRRFDSLPPRDRANVSRMVVGDHAGNKGGDKFVPPNEVAAADDQQRPDPFTGRPTPPEPPTELPPSPGGYAQPPKKRSFKEWLKGLSTSKKIMLTAAAALVVSGGIIGAYYLFFAESAPIPTVVKKEEPKEEPKPTTVASNLTGVQVDPSVNERPVIAVMIENSTDSRPQSGLNQAGVVFEAIAEGGITRFVALFQDTDPDYIGPVRSARPYYIQWMSGFDAGYVHAGGSADALSLIKQIGVKDLPHHNSYMWRVNNRTAPHNLYTSIAKLREYAAQKGFGKSNFTPLPRKDKETPSTAPTAKSIDLNISSSNYNVHYDYDASTNTYKRKVGGEVHTDEKSGAQIAPKVVVALIMPQGKNGIYYTYQTIGTGQVMVFQDGILKTGTWKKDGNSSNFSFTDSNGVEIKLNPGQTWFTALGEASRVTYAP